MLRGCRRTAAPSSPPRPPPAESRVPPREQRRLPRVRPVPALVAVAARPVAPRSPPARPPRRAQRVAGGRQVRQVRQVRQHWNHRHRNHRHWNCLLQQMRLLPPLPLLRVPMGLLPLALLAAAPPPVPPVPPVAATSAPTTRTNGTTRRSANDCSRTPQGRRRGSTTRSRACARRSGRALVCRFVLRLLTLPRSSYLRTAAVPPKMEELPAILQARRFSLVWTLPHFSGPSPAPWRARSVRFRARLRCSLFSL